MTQIAVERGEFAASFRGGTSNVRDRKSSLLRTCSDAVGASPDIILRQPETWETLPDHLKDYVRNSVRALSASKLPGTLIEKLFIKDDMEVLNLDDFPGVTNTFLSGLNKRIELERLATLSLVNDTEIRSSGLALFLRKCVNLSHLNLKGCVELKNETFPETTVKHLSQLSYLNVSFTQITGKALATVYSLCPKLATLKLAGCKVIGGKDSIANVFPQKSETLINLKLRHCTITQPQLQYILETLPNLQTLDCSSSSTSTVRSLRPFLSLSHPSQLRKVNLSNCPNLDLTKPVELNSFFLLNPKLEQIYLKDARVNARFVIPQESLANFKTLFIPGISNSTDFLPSILELAVNLTYLDLSHTNIRFDPLAYSEPLVFNVPRLQTLSLEKTPVNDDSTEILCQLHSLRSLFLGQTLISTNGVRRMVFACPWLEQLDLTSCRGVDVEDRRTLLDTLQKEFWEYLSEARQTGRVLERETSRWFSVETFHNDDEDRQGLMQLPLEDSD